MNHFQIFAHKGVKVDEILRKLEHISRMKPLRTNQVYQWHSCRPLPCFAGFAISEIGSGVGIRYGNVHAVIGSNFGLEKYPSSFDR